jgi:hypothetical protein
MNVIPKLLLTIPLVTLTPISLANDWTTNDTIRQAAVLGTFYLDQAQTKDIKNHPWAHETNPLLGRSPSDPRIRNYFLSAGLIHTAIAYKLPPEYRRGFQYTTLALQLAVIAHNKKIGLRFEF